MTRTVLKSELIEQVARRMLSDIEDYTVVIDRASFLDAVKIYEGAQNARERIPEQGQDGSV